MMLKCNKCDEIFHPDDLAGKCPFCDKELYTAGAAATGAKPCPEASSGQLCGEVDTDRQHGAPQANPATDNESTAQFNASEDYIMLTWALKNAYEAMNYMGDILNGRDMVLEEDEQKLEPLFKSVREALGVYK